MALVTLYGTPLVPIGPGFMSVQAVMAVTSTVLDAATEAVIFVGHVITSDGGSHTIDTTGSSSLAWRSGAVIFANAGTTVKIGLASVDTGTGPPARASNASDVITFDVSDSETGGGGGITANAWQTHVPDAGSKTIANGDLVAFAVQMTARGGAADTVSVSAMTSSNQIHRPTATSFLGGSYTTASMLPNVIITFSDGALGYFQASDIVSSINLRTWNSGGGTKEYGQLYKLPFPTKIYGLYGWVDPDADFDVVLYSAPLGTPVAEKTISLDANTTSSANMRRFAVTFAAPYSTTVDQEIGAVFKPGASSIGAHYKTLANAAHRIADPWGTVGYGISRASGAFADANSGLDHYYIGLIVGAFDAGGSAGGISRARAASGF